MADDEFTKLVEALKEFYAKKSPPVDVEFKEETCLFCNKEGIKASDSDPLYLCIEHVPLYIDGMRILRWNYDQIDLIDKFKEIAQKLTLDFKKEHLVRFDKSKGLIDIVIKTPDGNFGIEVINDKTMPQSKESKQYRRTVNYSRRKIKALGKGAIVFTSYLKRLDEQLFRKILSASRIRVYR